MNVKDSCSPYCFPVRVRRVSLGRNIQSIVIVILSVCMVIALSIQPVWAGANQSEGGSAPGDSKITLPKVFGEPRSISAFTAYGAATEQLALAVPAGRHGVEPKLTLGYNSSGGSGILGLGWSLESGYVEVMQGDGTPNVGSPDSYLFSVGSASGQLINTGDGVYRAKLENIYREFRRNATHGGWEMYNGEGVLHRFGGTPDSRVEGQQWMLDLVQDPHGNSMKYTYSRVGNALYIHEIQYTGYAPTNEPGANLVVFEYESRPDVRKGYRFYHLEEQSQRLARISVYASNELARRYEFVYESSALNGTSLLKQIILVGADDQSRITLRTYDYSTRTPGWDPLEQPSWPADANGTPLALVDADGSSTGVILLDVNGDGFADLLTNDSDVYLGDRAGGFSAEADPVWTASLKAAAVQFVIPSGDLKGVQKGVNLLDVNSDGLPDLFIAQNDRRQIYLNTGAGWSYTQPVFSGEQSTTGEQWTEGALGLQSISAQAVYSNTLHVTSPGVYDDAFDGWVYSSGWTGTVSDPGAYQNTLHTSGEAGQSASLALNGRQFALIYATGSHNGEIEIAVDGALVKRLDQSSATPSGQNRWISPLLSPGVHIVEVKHASGDVVNIDAIEIDDGLPGRISDLAVSQGNDEGSAVLSWTAPGNDGSSRRATGYLVRHSASAILTEDDWAAASPVAAGVPAPSDPGASETMLVQGLTAGNEYYFSVRAQDGMENLGALSNSPAVQLSEIEEPPGEDDVQVLTINAPPVPPLSQSANSGQQSFLEPFATIGPNGESKGVQLSDVNGDGRVDIVWSFSRTPASWEIPDCQAQHIQCEWLTQVRGVFLNTGEGWQLDPTLSESLKTIDFFVKDTAWMGYDLTDVNGDGLADIVRMIEGYPLQVLLGTGSGWTADQSGYLASLEDHNIFSLSADHKSQGLMPVDFNDDGLLDYFQANQTTTKAYANTGQGWVEAPWMADLLDLNGIAFSTAEGKGTGIQLIDLNGDGLFDLVKAQSGAPLQVWLSHGLRSGLLVQATSAIGEVTRLTWTASTQFDNRREDGIQGMPFSMPVVSSLERQDGRGNAYLTTYEYGGGLFTGRQLRGFRWSRETRPTGLLVETTYYQEDGLAGRPKVMSELDRQGLLRYQDSFHMEIAGSDAPEVKQVFVRQTEALWSDPGGSRRSTATYDYDARLNVISVLRDPDSTITGDESTTLFSWAVNLPAGFWGLTSRITNQGPDGSVLKEQIILYDDLPEGNVSSGLANEVRALVKPGVYIANTVAFDSYGNVKLTRDPENNPTLFQYDDSTATYMVKSVDAENRVEQSRFDPRFGVVTWTQNAAGNIATREYDAFGRLIRIVEPGDEQSPYGTQTVVYSPMGDATAQSYTVRRTETAGQPGTLDTTYFFNGMGKIYRAQQESAGARPVITTAEFDDADNPRVTSLPFLEGDTPSLTFYERDELHRPVKIIVPAIGETVISYAGARIDVVDPRGAKSSFIRDADGNTTAVHQWVGDAEYVTTYAYDAVGKLIRTTDALGEQTLIHYDLLGRRTQLDDPNAGTYQYSYDGAGRMTAQVGPDGRATTFQYNRAGDLLVKRFPDGAAQSFAYDPAGRPVQIQDAAGTVKFTYDARGHITQRQRTIQKKTYTTQYAFDSLSRVNKITYPDGFAVFYTYDRGGNLTSIKDNGNRVVVDGMTYSASGQLLSIRYGNGVQSAYAYDELARMSTINTYTATGTSLQDLAYSYDTGSNIVSIADHALGSSQQFAYDALGRLVQAEGPYGSEIYAYDAIGNLTQKGSLVFGTDPQHPQHVICGIELALLEGDANGIPNNPHASPCQVPAGPAGQPTGANAATGGSTNPNIARSFTIQYDAYGNVIQKGGTHYAYDFENHLVRISDAKGKLIAENTYDAAGQRVVQRTPSDTTVYIDAIYEEGKTSVSHHVMAGPQLVATLVTPRPAAETGQGVPADGVNALVAMAGLALLLVWMPFSGGQKKKWLAGLSLLKEAFQKHRKTLVIFLFVLAALVSSAAAPGIAGQAAAAKAAEKYYFYHSNHLGSTNVVTDQKGAVVERREYKPYGEVYQSSGAESGPREFLHTFDGVPYDDATGLYYMGARHYDPQIGRFLAADTRMPDPLNPRNLNRYAFAVDNPIRYVDPAGHEVAWWEVALAVVIIVVLATLAVVTLGVGIGILAGLAAASWGFLGVALLTGVVAGALIGGAVFGVVALTQGRGGADLWSSFLTGAAVGAAVGGAIALIPYSLGCWGAGFWFGLVTGVIVGAILGGGAAVAGYLAGGNPPGRVFQDRWGSIIEGMVKGAIIGLAVALLLAPVALSSPATIAMAAEITGFTAEQGAFYLWLGSTVVGGIFTAESLVEIGWSAADASNTRSLFNGFGLFTPIDNWINGWFYNSPIKSIGVPSWALSGGGRGLISTRLSAQMQTMPFAP